MSRSLSAMAASLSARLNRLIERLVAVGIWLLVADVSLSVASRYLFSTPYSWAEEVARYLLIWVALLAISIGVARSDHPKIDIFTQRLPRFARKLLLLLEGLVATAVFATLLYFGLIFVAQGTEQSSLTLGISMQVPHAAVPAAATFSLIQVWLVVLARFSSPDGTEFAS